MIKINLSQILLILSNLEKDKIILTDHLQKRLSEREISEELFYDCLINHNPKGILDQKADYNNVDKYKIYYKHPRKKDYDVIIVIVYDDSNKKRIRVLTTYIQKSRR